MKLVYKNLEFSIFQTASLSKLFERLALTWYKGNVNCKKGGIKVSTSLDLTKVSNSAELSKTGDAKIQDFFAKQYVIYNVAFKERFAHINQTFSTTELDGHFKPFVTVSLDSSKLSKFYELIFCSAITRIENAFHNFLCRKKGGRRQVGCRGSACRSNCFYKLKSIWGFEALSLQMKLGEMPYLRFNFHDWFGACAIETATMLQVKTFNARRGNCPMAKFSLDECIYLTKD